MTTQNQETQEVFADRHPKITILLCIIFAGAIIYGGFVMRNRIIAWEEQGGEISLPRFVIWIYDIFGANGVFAIISLLGSTIFLLQTFKLYKKIK